MKTGKHGYLETYFHVLKSIDGFIHGENTGVILCELCDLAHH